MVGWILVGLSPASRSRAWMEVTSPSTLAVRAVRGHMFARVFVFICFVNTVECVRLNGASRTLSTRFS